MRRGCECVQCLWCMSDMAFSRTSAMRAFIVGILVGTNYNQAFIGCRAPRNAEW